MPSKRSSSPSPSPARSMGDRSTNAQSRISAAAPAIHPDSTTPSPAANSNATTNTLRTMFNDSNNPRFTRSTLNSVGGDDNRYNNRNTHNTVNYNIGNINIPNLTLSGDANITFRFGPHEASSLAASTQVETSMPMHRRGQRDRRRGLERVGEVSRPENHVPFCDIMAHGANGARHRFFFNTLLS
ncbi:hypothetical protein VKT23_000422 [Stygiomarasmius scandens]|uniref:Uncharacterized protein n=1 Tax=Marasmiellus scandens TaxID=2682957 RepID=A0ABR1K518_9AGAR